MWQTALNTIGTAAVAALVTVICVAIKSIGGALATLIGKKAAALEAKIGADTLQQNLTFAKSAWNIVDEKFRITPTLEKTFAAKQAEFAIQIKKLIPGITDDYIEQLRQAVAGEVNAGKKAVEAAAADADGDVPVGSASESGAVAPSTNGAE